VVAEAREDPVHALGLQHVDADAVDHARAATMRAFISQTAAASPLNTARAMMA
jgi:hypothetical protein